MKKNSHRRYLDFLLRFLDIFEKNTDTAYLWIGVLIYGIVLYFASMEALQHAFYFDGYPTNGAFQLLDPLRRVADGQIVGKDFFVFHGIGAVFLHYPIFALFGKNIFASQLAHYFVSPLLFMLSSILFGFVVFEKEWRKGIFVTSIVVGYYWMRQSILITPGNSILGVRSIGPIFGFVLLYAALRFGFQKISRSLEDQSLARRIAWNQHGAFGAVAGLVCAAVFFISTEHGLAFVLGFGVATLLVYPASVPHRFVVACVSGVSFLLGVTILFSMASGRYALDAIRYALVDVPSDQFWYFGAPPNRYLTQGIDSDWFIPILFFTVLALTAVLFVVAYKKRSFAHYSVWMVLLYSLGTFIPQLGYYGRSYAEPAVRMLVGLAIVLLWSQRTRIGAVAERITQRMTYPSVFVFVCILFLVYGFFTVKQTAYYIQSPMQQLRHLVVGLPRKRSSVTLDGAMVSDKWAKRYAVAVNAMSDDLFFIEPVTNEDWKNGVSKNKMHILVRSTVKRQRLLQAGQTIQLPQTGKHTVISVQPWEGDIVEVALDKPVDVALDVYPAAVDFSKSKRPLLWSTYAGVIESQLNVFHPSYDYIIHALGEKKRAQYVSDLKEMKPRYVSVVRDDFFIYEPWLRSENWPFYKALLEQYVPTTSSDYAVMFKRNKKSSIEKTGPETDIEIIPHVGIEPFASFYPVKIDEAKPQILIMTLQYTVHNPWSAVPYIGKVPRYIVHSSTAGTQDQHVIPTALIPYQTTMEIPFVITDKDRLVELSLETAFRLPGLSVSIDRASYHLMTLTPEATDLFLKEYRPKDVILKEKTQGLPEEE